MAQIADETLLVQSAREVVHAKDHKETDHTIRDFWKSTEALRDMLDQDRSVNDLELLLLENHFHVLQLAYLRWKRKQRVLATDSAGSYPPES